MEMSQVFTAMAYILFADENVDIAVIEVRYLFPYIFNCVLYINILSGDSSIYIVVTSSHQKNLGLNITFMYGLLGFVLVNFGLFFLQLNPKNLNYAISFIIKFYRLG